MNIHPQSYATLRRILLEVEQPDIARNRSYEMSVPTYLRLKEIADDMFEYDQKQRLAIAEQLEGRE